MRKVAHAYFRRRLLRFEAMEERCLLAYGDIDLSFGQQGIATIRNDESLAGHVIPKYIHTSQGNTYTVNEVIVGLGRTIGISKFSPMGFPDVNFGYLARVIFSPQGELPFTFKTYTQSNDQLLIHYRGDRNELIRLLPNGQIDANFGTAGAIIDNDGLNEFFIGRDDSIFSIVSSPDFPSKLIRFTQDGELNSSWQTTELPSAFRIGRYQNVVQADDGRIYVASINNLFSVTPEVTIVRMETNGGIDQSFGTNGIAAFSVPNGMVPHGASLHISNAIYLACPIVDTEETQLFKLGLNGQPDSTFGNNGVVSVPQLSATGPWFSALSFDNAIGLTLVQFRPLDIKLSPWATLHQSISPLQKLGSSFN